MSHSSLSASRGSSRLLLSVHGVVYDVGDFAADHPGGREVLQQWAGSEATDAFVEALHPDDSWLDMRRLAVATLSSDTEQHATHAAALHSAQHSTQPQAAQQSTDTSAVATPGASTTATDAAVAAPAKTSQQSTSDSARSATHTPVRCLIVHGSQTGTASSQQTSALHRCMPRLRCAPIQLSRRHCALCASRRTQNWPLSSLRTSSRPQQSAHCTRTHMVWDWPSLAAAHSLCRLVCWCREAERLCAGGAA